MLDKGVFLSRISESAFEKLRPSFHLKVSDAAPDLVDVFVVSWILLRKGFCGRGGQASVSIGPRTRSPFWVSALTVKTKRSVASALSNSNPLPCYSFLLPPSPHQFVNYTSRFH